MLCTVNVGKKYINNNNNKTGSNNNYNKMNDIIRPLTAFIFLTGSVFLGCVLERKTT